MRTKIIQQIRRAEELLENFGFYVFNPMTYEDDNSERTYQDVRAECLSLLVRGAWIEIKNMYGL